MYAGAELPKTSNQWEQVIKFGRSDSASIVNRIWNDSWNKCYNHIFHLMDDVVYPLFANRCSYIRTLSMSQRLMPLVFVDCHVRSSNDSLIFEL